ncbi:hypothetical protein KGA66_22805 [Actinocrinis puniceicyclus]|uniref:Uncharacterized protein n=1 Tax=Actinocrinis puniceicyclus TaxID=977794 RepID=A0A8J7WTV1_9ACTN|nr:hypothetical protein [Actinocrinis puniceicyclus]MBS2965897.1 hypothetical protein [Actinocrinis puniceicyclus]
MPGSATIAALGADARTRGYALAGVRVAVAEDDESVHAAWRGLPPEVAIVILTPDAARVLGPALLDASDRLTVVMP